MKKNIEKKEYYRRASNKEGQVFSYAWKIEESKGTVVLVHDIMEHAGRYEEFAMQLNEAGYSVYANDLIGHGMSKQGHRGAFAMSKGGFGHLFGDINSLFELADDEDGKHPHILIGLGIGAEIAELYAFEYKNIDKLILLSNYYIGTSLKTILTAANNHVRMNGENAESLSVHTLMMNVAKMPGSDPANQFYWVTSDEDEVRKYTEDENCGFILASSAYRDILIGLQKLQGSKGRKNCLKIPMLILSGEDDSLGNYGKAARNCYHDYIDSGNNNIKIKIFNDARHDLLHEKCKNEVFSLIKEWLEDN